MRGLRGDPVIQGIVTLHARKGPSGRQPSRCQPADGKVIYDSRTAAETVAAALVVYGQAEQYAYRCELTTNRHFHLATKMVEP